MNNRRILLVDDDKKELNRLAATVKKLGMEQIVTADRGDKAWMILKTNKIDAVISAYDMSEMSGLALLKITRREEGLSGLPFFLTDRAFTKIKVIRAGQTGVSGLFVIPYEEQAMVRKLSAALFRKEDPLISKASATVETGMRYIEEKKYDKALEVFTTLVGQKENPEYYFNIGYIKTFQGKHSEAIEAFMMATRLDRLFAKAYEEMGRVYRLMGDLGKAEESMRLAAEIYMDTDKIGSAEEILTELLESGTTTLNVFNTLGVLYRKKGEPESALAHYQKALKVHPDEPYIYYNIGRLYLDMKDMERAKQYFQSALVKDPGFDEAKQVIKAIDLGMV